MHTSPRSRLAPRREGPVWARRAPMPQARNPPRPMLGTGAFARRRTGPVHAARSRLRSLIAS
ncbi:Hypothetical protein A7982_07624 [Minicystis rosea]|nr:Hypothetical protein A7982_07624 [Minicystis rosea]